MATFSEIILPALNAYKAILRKKFTSGKAENKIKELKLKRVQLQSSSELALYRIANNIIIDCENYINDVTDDPVYHFGMADFAEYLKNTLKEYAIEGNKVVHRKQEASRLILQVIQLISFPPEKFDFETISDCIEKIKTIGSPEQKDNLKLALQKQSNMHPKLSSVFCRL
jgi:hypothetical protein